MLRKAVGARCESRPSLALVAWWRALAWARRMHAGRGSGVVVVSTLLGCGDRYWVCDDPDEGRLRNLPQQLSETGLFDDVSAEELAAGVVAYRPQFELWSDGARKRRWFWLPDGATIDTSDADDWIFPVDTKVWKEFSRDGTKIETRLITKIGPDVDDWLGVSYLWQEGGGDAVIAPYGVQNAGGTAHDVPGSNECCACHGGTRSFVLGLSTVQLLEDASSEEVDLGFFRERGLLSDPIDDMLTVPGTATERAALGYLHANCGHCHNGARPKQVGARCFDPEMGLDFRLSVRNLASVEGTAAWRAIRDGDDGPRAIAMMSERGFFRQMPPLATERVDTVAVELVRGLVEGQ